MHPFPSSVRPAGLVLAALLLTGLPAAAAAQTPGPERTAPAVETAVPTIIAQRAEQTRQDLEEVLEQYPPSLGRVLRLDPTLLTNDAYLASYPALATFLARHPDVPRNPGFYFERYGSTYVVNEPVDARQQALRMWNDALEFLGAFAIFLVVVFVLYRLIRYIVEYRRWLRTFKINADVHNKILDRFGSNEELLAYVESPAGRRFLESGPVAPVEAPAPAAGAPFGRMLLSVQVGVILLALGVGLLIIGSRAIEEVQPVITSLAVLGFCLGIGSIASAGASYVLSRRLGLLPEPAETRSERVI